MKSTPTDSEASTTMNLLASLTRGLRRAALPALLLAVPLASFAAEPRTFATPEAAVEALYSALKANDEPALVAIMGDKHRNLIVTGDAAHDAARRAEVAALLATYRSLDDSAPDRRVLLLGAKAWPLPIPLVRQGASWRFDAEQGAEEMLNRRVGRNERSAIEVLGAYVDAQREYASRDRDGDGVLQYAARLGSSPGKKDGLYWDADSTKGEEASPFGPLIAQSAAYLSGHRRGDAYRGYHFRILTSQGKSAPGGMYNYVINGRLLAGFAMVAYPDIYGETGVMTFIVNQNGKIFEKDLGSKSSKLGEALPAFNPGAGWRAIAP